MRYWLLKSEPHSYSWQDMLNDKRTHWEGVRNYQARNFMRDMNIGDKAYFYHSGKERQICGVVDIVKTAYPDHTDDSGKFIMVDVANPMTAKNALYLSDIKAMDECQDFGLVKQARLSVMPVPENIWHLFYQKIF